MCAIKIKNNERADPLWSCKQAPSKSLQALARRLLIHLPRGHYVEEVVRSLVIGRLCYGSALFPLRLANEDPACQLLQTIQVRVNDTARLLLGAARVDRIPTEELLFRTGLPSLNRNAIRAAVLELWKALNSSDGADGERNPLGMILSSPPTSQPTRCTRSVKAGNLPPPLLKKDNVFLWNAVQIYNDLVPLRSTVSLAAVQKLADSYSSAAPL